MGEEPIKLQAVRGMHDRMPEEMRRREKIIVVIKSTFEKYGFEPLETPAVEYWDILSGKDRYGEDEKLIYKFKDRGGRDAGLRFDFTVPLARVVAMNPDLPIPFKRYQIQPVWRGDSPQYGRFREFYQCDADIVGTYSMIAEAEIISITYEIFKTLGFKDFKIRINNRKILRAICELCGVPREKEFDVYRAMDKMERIGIDGVAEKLEFSGIHLDTKEKVIDTLRECKSLASLTQIIPEQKGIQELTTLFNYLEEFNISKSSFLFDIWLARGLDYYTGPIFETQVERPKVGSLASGGRFDNLIGMFMGSSGVSPHAEIPAVGISIGLERLMIALKELNLMPQGEQIVKVLVAQFDESHSFWAIKTARELRNLKIPTEIYPDFVKLAKQFKYADKRGIPYVIVVGPDEVKTNQVTIKDMRTGKQQQLEMKNLNNWAKGVK